MPDENQTTEFTDVDIPIRRVVRTPYSAQLRAAHAELVRLREFVQWVADHSNDPAVVHEAVLMGADLSKEQVDARGF